MFTLENFIHENTMRQLDIDAIMVVQSGKTLGFECIGRPALHNVFSVAKTFTVTGIGMAVDAGLLHLSDKPVDCFEGLFSENTDPRWQNVTLEHLLTMTFGHGAAHMMAAERKYLRSETDKAMSEAVKNEWLRYAFACPMIYEPGEHFCYGNLAPYVAGRMLEKVTGMSIRDYLFKKFW